MDSKQMVNALLEVDPGFEQLCKTLFGDLVEPADVWDFMYEHDGLSRHMPVTKAQPDPADVHAQYANASRRMRGYLKATRGAVPVVAGGGALVGTGYMLGKKKSKKPQIVRYDSEGRHELGKSDSLDVVWQGTFSKTDEEKRQAFGWASVVEVDGKPIIDRQGDWITPDEIEKAAYNYVLHNRRGGHQHKRDDQDQPVHASDLIESFVVTPEKIEKMGLPKETPVGWWVGYKVHDDEAWEKIKKGDVTGFSIHGRGKRRDVEQ